MELLSLKEHEILVIGFDQLWKEEMNNIYSHRVEETSVCRFYEGANVKFIRPGFIRISILDYASFFFSSLKEIYCESKRFKPDVIIGFSSIITNFWGLHIAKRLRIPYIYYCYDNPSALLVPKPFIPIAEKIVCHIMKRADKVLTINNALNNYVIGLGANPKTTIVLPQGVDTKRFNPLTTNASPIREKYNIKEDDKLLFFMGWLYPFLGLKDIITEMYKNRYEISNIKLMIVGYGPDFEYLDDLVRTYGLDNHILLTGKKRYEEIPDLISAADICLQPAHNDPIIRDIAPIKMYEYLAMHKPVISTKLPGVMEEFSTDNGVIFVNNPRDIIKMANMLNKIDLESTGIKAKEFIKDYSWNEIIVKFECILHDLIQDKGVYESN